MDKILLLQSLPGFGGMKIREFLKENHLFINDMNYMKHFIESLTGQSVEFYTDRVERLIERSCKLGVEIIHPDINTVDAPVTLFLKGDTELLKEEKLMAVVGTRQPSGLGVKLGRRYVTRLVENNWVTVSGLARGCDTICHRTTLNHQGKTIAVIPRGYDSSVAPWILETGLIVSEYPPGYVIKKYRCVERNRIITALSKGLFVMESQKGGGSEHSIRFAYREGIPVAYGIGFPEISRYDATKIETIPQFDHFLKKCIE